MQANDETWKPLSIRTGKMDDDGPYEGVPPHLYQPLRAWVDTNLGGRPNLISDTYYGPRLAAAIRHEVVPSPGRNLTVREVTASLYHAPDLMLDAVDAALHLEELEPRQYDDLDELLLLGGSAWQADHDTRRLIRRVDPAAGKSFAEASSPGDAASAQLREAWAAAYGRSPDASDAWDHSIKALENLLIPIVVPAKKNATLGDVVGTLHSQGQQWQFYLHGHDGSRSVAPLVSMLRLIWPNPDRHGSGAGRKPSLDEAQAVVHLAVTIVQWGRSGGLSKR